LRSVDWQSSPVKSRLFQTLKGKPGLRGLSRDLRTQSSPRELLERWKIVVCFIVIVSKSVFVI
jgi:hypothetical protein